MAFNRFLEIVAMQPPFSYGLDANENALFSCNYRMKLAGPVSNLEESIISILASKSLAVLGVDTFAGQKVSIPRGEGPYTTVILTGGLESDMTHNGDRYINPTVQIIVTAQKYSVAELRARSIFNALDGIRNLTVTV